MPDPKPGSEPRKSSATFTDWAWDQTIPQGPKIVVLVLARHVDSEGCCYPGQARIAELAGMGERAARRHLEWLEREGLISRGHRYRGQRRTSDFYRLRPATPTAALSEGDVVAPSDAAETVPVDVTGSLPVDVTGTPSVPVDLAPLPVDLAPLPARTTGTSYKEDELLQRELLQRGTSPGSATSRAPSPPGRINMATTNPADSSQSELPLGPVAVATSPQQPRKSQTAPGKKNRKAKPLDEHGLIADSIVKSWWERQELPPASGRFVPIRGIVASHIKAGWTPDKIATALDAVIASGWAVTQTTLENALRRATSPVPMAGRTAGGYMAYRDPVDESGYHVSLADALRARDAERAAAVGR